MNLDVVDVPNYGALTGRRLRALRDAKGWTRRDLSKLLDVAEGTLYNYEEKGRRIPLSTWIATATVAGVSPSWREGDAVPRLDVEA